MKPIVFTPSARAEFEAAAEWYESHADGLGENHHCQCLLNGCLTAAEHIHQKFPA
jgi:hypothetical protein